MAELVSSVYAESLFEVAVEEHALDRIRASYDAFMGYVRENPALLDVLAAPTIARGDKNQLIDAMQFEPLFHNFLNILLDKRRIGHLSAIHAEFERMVREHFGIVTAHVASYQALTEQQRAELKHKLDQSTGKQVELVETVDPTLVGGFRIRIGDTVLDGSVHHQLQKLLDRLTSAVVG